MQAHENPFATDRVERLLSFRPVWSTITWEQLDQAWQQAGFRGAITGRHGAGKTTLISSWKHRLAERGTDYLELFLNREAKSLSEAEWESLEDPSIAQKIVILDGDEQLGYFDRRRFYRLTQQAKGLIVTRHRQNHLSTLAHLDPSIDILKQCVKELAPQHYPALEPHFQAWWKSKKGNIREILLECYDAIAAR